MHPTRLGDTGDGLDVEVTGPCDYCPSTNCYARRRVIGVGGLVTRAWACARCRLKMREEARRSGWDEPRFE